MEIHRSDLEESMFLDTIQNFSAALPYLFFPLLILVAYLLYRGTKFILARLFYRIAMRTETIYDDLIVDRLQPFRFAWLLPLLLIFFFADTLFPGYLFVKKLVLILSIGFLADLLIAILSGVNDIYKNNPRYTGASVAGYIGLLQVITAVTAIVLSISYLTDIELVALLSGVGAWLAVLLLIFRDTILSFIASIQISTQNLIKEGDMVDIPAFGASGTITEIDLQTVTVQNWDNTNTSIPTSRIVDSGLKNYRLMIESGARRVKRSIIVEVDTIKFVDQALVKRLASTDFIQQRIGDELQDDTQQTTNLEQFIHYTQAYLRSIKEVRQRRYPLFVRILESTSEGLPVDIIIFVKVADLDKYYEIQAEIILHLIAVLPFFDLKSYQLQPNR